MIPISIILENKERQRHQIPDHLYKEGNTLCVCPLSLDEVKTKLQSLLLSYAFDVEADSLVLCTKQVNRIDVIDYVALVDHVLQELNNNAKAKASYTVDWWYRPLGQALGHALIAIRPHGLYELTFGT